jgi:hypothetical protein
MKVLIARSEQGLGPILGYDVAGELIGAKANPRHMGQVCSLVDLACFYAGYPMLALNGVRTKSGEIHEHLLTYASAESIEVAIAMQSKWNVNHLPKLFGGLRQVKAGAKTGWREVSEMVALRGQEYVIYNLHRKLDHFLELAQL